jgi:hypothetical protein
MVREGSSTSEQRRSQRMMADLYVPTPHQAIMDIHEMGSSKHPSQQD